MSLANKKLNLLFQPFQFGKAMLPNRIVMSPMSRYKSPNSIPNSDVAAYYRKRAEGGVGLIITEGTTIQHAAAHGHENVPAFHGAALAGWHEVVKQVHEAGGHIVPQLWHVGGTRDPSHVKNPEIPAYAPSAVIHPANQQKNVTPLALSHSEIDFIIQAFIEGARAAKKIGFDGVELHGAHGYLIDQFFWHKTNLRHDQYGGKKISERTRFAVEIISGIRQAVGNEFPIIFRFSQWKSGDYEAHLVETPQELEELLIPLANAGVDIFHASTRRYYEPAFPKSHLNLAGWAKRITGKSVITVGSVGLDTEFHKSVVGLETKKTNIHDLLDRLENNEFDLVALGRTLIANPDWPKKIKSEKYDDIHTFSADMLKTLS